MKPDILAPTGTESTARGEGEVCGIYGGTSGAAPYAAGAAALFKQLVVQNFDPAVYTDANDPGLIYALMILSGEKAFSYVFSHWAGAGLIRLPITGGLRFGIIELEREQMAAVEIPGVQRGQVIDAALWWPEHYMDIHRDFDLEIWNPTKGRKNCSQSTNSVFERARANADIDGTWSLRVTARGSDDETRRVYWAALVAAPEDPPLPESWACQ